MIGSFVRIGIPLVNRRLIFWDIFLFDICMWGVFGKWFVGLEGWDFGDILCICRQILVVNTMSRTNRKLLLNTMSLFCMFIPTFFAFVLLLNWKLGTLGLHYLPSWSTSSYLAFAILSGLIP